MFYAALRPPFQLRRGVGLCFTVYARLRGSLLALFFHLGPPRKTILPSTRALKRNGGAAGLFLRIFKTIKFYGANNEIEKSRSVNVKLLDWRISNERARARELYSILFITIQTRAFYT